MVLARTDARRRLYGTLTASPRRWTVQTPRDAPPPASSAAPAAAVAAPPLLHGVRASDAEGPAVAPPAAALRPRAAPTGRGAALGATARRDRPARGRPRHQPRVAAGPAGRGHGRARAGRHRLRAARSDRRPEPEGRVRA